MENMIRQMGKKVFLISLIIVVFITIVIEVYPSNGSLMSEGILKTGQIIALLMCVIPAIIGFVMQFKIDMRKKVLCVWKNRLIFPKYIMFIYAIRQIIEKDIDILNIVLAVVIAIVVSFVYIFYFSTEEKDNI